MTDAFPILAITGDDVVPARCLACPAFNKVLVIQDSAEPARELEEAVKAVGCWLEVTTASVNLPELTEFDYEFVVWDSHLAREQQVTLLHRWRQKLPRLPVIVLADGPAADSAIELMKAGAFDVLAKPLDSGHLQQALERALRSRHLMCDAVLIPTVPELRGSANRLIGRSLAMQEVYKKIGLVAERDEPVLLYGETGTGKELVARAIYQNSRRKEQPFLALNCAALPESLLESELFGYEKGAFTGAVQRRLGAFERAHGGTLFLDEISDMPLVLQAKILRALQEGEIQRLGGNEMVPVNVRILAATNRALQRAVEEGRFREDLYYRLNVVSIRLPALRERAEDILELVEYFIARYTAAGEPRPSCESRALPKLQAHPWPGNVRELENSVRRALVIAKGPILMEYDFTLGDAPPEAASLANRLIPQPTAACSSGLCQAANPDAQLDLALRQWLARHAQVSTEQSSNLSQSLESKLLSAALQFTNGNQVQAANLLGISRSTLRARLKKSGG